MLEVADLKAETINVIGKGEKNISKVMASRRKYEYLDKKMDVIINHDADCHKERKHRQHIERLVCKKHQTSGPQHAGS